MKSILFTALLLLGLGFEAQAHAHLQQAVPADGSVIVASPEKISLSFSHEVRITSLTLQVAGGKSQALEGLPAQTARSHSVAAPKLAPGEYTVNWRALGADNHVMSGAFRFTFTGPGK